MAENKLDKLIEEIGKLTILEVADLVKALEEKFGVPTLMAPTAPTVGTSSAGATGTTATGTTTPAGEQTSFTVILTTGGANKIAAIKTVKEINQALGLKEAKDLVEAAPKEILTNVNKETAEEIKKKLEAVGAGVEIK
jgi:large subunit ribosomal protein L7/L12